MSACRKTKPSLLVRAVAKAPALFLLILLCMMAAGCVLPFLKPPAINTAFETLTVQGQPINHAVEASALLTTAASAFWAMDPSPSASDSSGSSRRRLLGKGDSGSKSAKKSQDSPVRKFAAQNLHVIYHRPDKATMLTRDMIARIRAVEDEVYALPDFQRLCVQRGKGRDAQDCRRPVSVTSFMYGEVTEDGFEPNGDSDRMLDPKRSAQVCHISCSAVFYVALQVL